MPDTHRTIWQTEPAVVIGAVSAILAAAVSLGLALTGEQQAALVTAVGAIWALVQALATRSQVIPAAAEPGAYVGEHRDRDGEVVPDEEPGL